MSIIQKIRIKSDGDELQFSTVGKVGTIAVLNYVYTLSKEKYGLTLPLPQEQLDKMLQNNIAEILK
jgi:hypothetical protein